MGKWLKMGMGKWLKMGKWKAWESYSSFPTTFRVLLNNKN
jgi:hypothetical protein